jgi:hypothetical protein
VFSTRDVQRGERGKATCINRAGGGFVAKRGKIWYTIQHEKHDQQPLALGCHSLTLAGGGALAVVWWRVKRGKNGL